ncbi:hypothetical protein GC163_08425 [bacterium]|nr:hypothetical protein [bacterium]
MDPDTALKELLLAVEVGDVDRVEELAEGLLNWLERGGFPPLTIGPRELGVEWHRTIATAACQAAISECARFCRGS